MTGQFGQNTGQGSLDGATGQRNLRVADHSPRTRLIMSEMPSIVQVAGNAPVVATADWDGPVQIWNADTGNRLTTFTTVYDTSGRLAIDLQGERIVAANWRKGEKGGIACYNATSGGPIWHRTDIGQVQHMQFSPREDRVWCKIDRRPVHCLDAGSGSTLAIVRNAEEAFDSPYTPHTFFFRHKDMALEDGRRRITMPRWAFSPEVSFSPDAVCVAEMRNEVSHNSQIRCFDIESGKERWRYICPDDSYIQLISFQRNGYLYGVQAAGQHGQVERKTVLLRLTLDGASCTEVCQLDATVRPYFGGFGDGILVTPIGEVRSLETGALLRSLIF